MQVQVNLSLRTNWWLLPAIFVWAFCPGFGWLGPYITAIQQVR